VISQRAAVLALLSRAHRATTLGACGRLPAGPRPHHYGHATRARAVVLPTARQQLRHAEASRCGRLRRATARSGSRLRSWHLGLFRGAVDRRSSGWLAFPGCRLPLPLGAWFGPKGAARGRVDALVAVIPADPIARRRIAPQHFLNDTRAGSAVNRLRLGYDALADCKDHARSQIVCTSEDSRRQASAPRPPFNPRRCALARQLICHNDQSPIRLSDNCRVCSTSCKRQTAPRPGMPPMSAWRYDQRAGAGTIKVFGLDQVVSKVREVALQTEYRDNPVLVTMKVLDAAGTQGRVPRRERQPDLSGRLAAVCSNARRRRP
jgi:hypothetical protein